MGNYYSMLSLLKVVLDSSFFLFVERKRAELNHPPLTAGQEKQKKLKEATTDGRKDALCSPFGFSAVSFSFSNGPVQMDLFVFLSLVFPLALVFSYFWVIFY